MIQSEQELEENLIKPLTDLGYKAVNITNSEQLTANKKNNLKNQKKNKIYLQKILKFHHF